MTTSVCSRFGVVFLLLLGSFLHLPAYSLDTSTPSHQLDKRGICEMEDKRSGCVDLGKKACCRACCSAVDAGYPQATLWNRDCNCGRNVPPPVMVQPPGYFAPQPPPVYVTQPAPTYVVAQPAPIWVAAQH